MESGVMRRRVLLFSFCTVGVLAVAVAVRLTRVDLAVVAGEADLMDCEGRLVSISSGQSTSVLGSAAGCARHY